MHILGISAWYHDSAAALVRDGEIVAAAQEERFSRQKHDDGFPHGAVRYCLDTAGVRAEDVELIGFYEKPLMRFERLIETYLAVAPRGLASFRQALPRWLGSRMFIAREIDKALGLKKKRYVFAEHHESHAAGAFFPSPFDEAAILTMDGVGEWATASLGRGEGNRIEISHEIRFPHSLGLLYSAFTSYLGFQINDGEYKVMGLAPYGEPRFARAIREHLIHVRPDGSFWMDMAYFRYCEGLTMTSERFHALFGGPPRRSDEPIDQRHMDVAASVQKVVEEVVLAIVRHLHTLVPSKNLVLSGGVALNCVANGRVEREGPFERIWIQPAAGDAGSALGVALLIQHQLLQMERRPRASDEQRGSLLGPRHDMVSIEAFLRSRGARYERLSGAERAERIAQLLDEGKVVAFFQDRMEFGPRALGSRSLLGDPRRADMQSQMNVKVKFRESFRPFAPCVLAERASAWFDVREGYESPYMLLVTQVDASRKVERTNGAVKLSGLDRLKEPRSTIPAVTHVDDSARVQTVEAARHPGLREVLEAFERRTGCPVLVNTSFNLGWEPIVESPEDAWRTFMSCDVDALVLEDALALKGEQRAELEARRIDPVTRVERDPAIEALMRCPACGGAMRVERDRARCAACPKEVVREHGIWRLFHPHEPFEGDVTDLVKGFYEEHPFPNYDEHESLRSLIDKARRGVYARLLGEQIPFDARVLEVGCGTGQLSNFLGIGCRTVVGADLCLNSLRLAEGFRARHGLQRVRFVQMNLFKPAFAPESFDVVLCNGVLHHTGDPRGGFESIAKLVRPGGHAVIGLYNTWGRLALDTRRMVFKLTGGRFKALDPYMRTTRMSAEKQDAWFHDQYRHPHESKHTMGELIDWFDRAGFEFVNAVPKTNPWEQFSDREQLFERSTRGTRVDRALAQAKMVFTGSREGGFYVMIAKKSGA